MLELMKLRAMANKTKGKCKYYTRKNGRKLNLSQSKGMRYVVREEDDNSCCWRFYSHAGQEFVISTDATDGGGKSCSDDQTKCLLTVELIPFEFKSLKREI